MGNHTELQGHLLDMLKAFHSFCVVEKLRYYTVGGTTLGAIRHNGFIPWDDDVDVGMPRADYERLIQITELRGVGISDHYIIESVSSPDKDYCYAYAKMYDTTTTMIENTRIHLKRGIYIDIFPIDGIGNSEKEAKRQFAPIQKKKELLGLRTMEIRKKRAAYKNLLLKLTRLLPASIAGEKRLCREIDSLCRQKDFDACVFVGNLVGAWGWKEVMPRVLFGNPTLHKFEDMEVYCEECADEYLQHLYGDWRKLPPKEKQISHHDYELDIKTSYLSK